MGFGVPGFPTLDVFEIVLFIIEWMPVIVAINILAVFAVKSSARPWVILFIPMSIFLMVTGVIFGSREDAIARGFDMSLPSLREKLEDYIQTGAGDLNEILPSEQEQLKYPPTFGMHEIKYLLKDLLSHTFLHLDTHNSDNIAEGYNKGNDWFEATLGDPMVYTSGIYLNGNEDLNDGQRYKLDYVANAIELKKGDKVLDIGCGWGRLVQHFSDEYGAHVTGVSLSEEQVKYGRELNKHNDGKILLQDAMKIEEVDGLMPEGGFDAITSLEMAEHVGIKRYNEFLTKVHRLLKDDGTFYFQVAGLRREWRYEDLVWGLFMGENVFPGADASCPLGWVSTQLERAGFEIQRVSNLGVHYSRTLDQWLQVWRSKKDYITNKYGAQSYRRWEVFLAWSVRVARQGSSTVFMFTLTKHNQEPTRIRQQQRLVPTF